MCLGHTAKEEFNIVELVTGEGDDAKGVPIATLHAKSMPTVSELFLIFYFCANDLLLNCYSPMLVRSTSLA